MASVRNSRFAAFGAVALGYLLAATTSASAHGGRCEPSKWPGALPAAAADEPPPVLPSPAHVVQKNGSRRVIAWIDGLETIFNPETGVTAAFPTTPAYQYVMVSDDAPLAPAAPAVPADGPPAPVAPPAPTPPAAPPAEAPVAPAATPVGPPPPPPPVMAIPDGPPVPTGLVGAGKPATSSGPAPSVRTRPPEPPPPTPEITADGDFRNRDQPLGPPLPPPDPFDPRAIQFRHDREVSGDGRITEIRHIPQWVDVIDKRELEEGRPFSMAEIAVRQPNVMFADGGSPFLAVPIIRGLSGDRVKIMTDGVWPSSQALGVAGGTLSLWDPESTDHVEIYHGPGASLRGAEATGGVINVVPIRPHRHECLEAWGRVATAYNSADNRFRERVQAEVGQGRIAALAGLTYEDHGNRDTAGGLLNPSTFTDWAGDLAVDYFLDNQSTLGVTAQHFQAEDIRTPLAGGGAYNQPKYARTFLGLTLTSASIGPVFHGTRFSFAFDDFLQNDNQTPLLGNTNGISSTDKTRRFDFRIQGNLYLAACHETWAELALSYAHLDRTESILCVRPANVPELPFIPKQFAVTPQADPGVCINGTAQYEANEWILKGLLEDEWYDGCWDYRIGGRVDWHHIDDNRTGESSDDFLFGAAGGVVHQLSKCWSTYANGSYGRRLPSLDELFSIAILNGVTVFPDPSLRPETSIAGEVGIRGTRWNNWTWSGDVFAHYLSDYIGRRHIGADDVWSNFDNVFLYGLETTGSFRPAPCACEGLEFFGTAGLTLSSDHGIIDPMPLAGRLGTRWSNCAGCPGECGLRRWFVEGAVRGALDQGQNPSDTGNGFATVELLGGVGWSMGGRRAVQATAGITNLFDERYTEPFSRLPAAGRSLFVSFQADF